MDFDIVGRSMYLSLRFDYRENGYKNVVLKQVTRCIFNVNVIN